MGKFFKLIYSLNQTDFKVELLGNVTSLSRGFGWSADNGSNITNLILYKNYKINKIYMIVFFILYNLGILFEMYKNRFSINLKV